jgi:hypothetical protein
MTADPETISAVEGKRLDVLLDRAIDSFGRLAMHEAGVIDGHLDGLRVRWAVARRARSLSELLRDQYDLLPDTRARIARDHRERLRLWRGLRDQPAA